MIEIHNTNKLHINLDRWLHAHLHPRASTRQPLVANCYHTPETCPATPNPLGSPVVVLHVQQHTDADTAKKKKSMFVAVVAILY